jgi:Fic family protein
MRWIWKNKEWPNYRYDEKVVEQHNVLLGLKSGVLTGSTKYMKNEDSKQLIVTFLSQEALSSSLIEGEALERESVQSSVKKHLGLKVERRKIRPKEYGIAEMMVHQHKTSHEPLTHDMMHLWSTMLMHDRRDVEKGAYRTHEDPMQIVSGNLADNTVFYEAPPSKDVPRLMDSFVSWYNLHSKSKEEYSTVSFAAHAHLYFEQIHPYEDGNGRIGRVLTEKAIALRLGGPFLSSLAKMVEQRKKEYYALLKKTNHSLDTDEWLEFFGECILSAQDYSINLVDFVIQKYHYMERFRGKLNSRQEKVVLRMFEEGLEGFKGGLSASNYKSIVKTSDATATRDLTDLVAKGALSKTGQLKGTRYYLKLPELNGL